VVRENVGMGRAAVVPEMVQNEEYDVLKKMIFIISKKGK
jgi:hypothetical protein